MIVHAWKPYIQDKQFCAIGSVKSNIGHADAAAGIAGLLKVILSLKHEQLPAILNYDQPNPAIDYPESSFFVQEKSGPWSSERSTQLAAVSSFGMSGTNAHAIIAQGHTSHDVTTEQATEPVPSQQPQRLRPFSARTDQSLDSLLTSWQSKPQPPSTQLLDVLAFTLQQGRIHFARRAFAICDSHDSSPNTN